MSSSISRVIFLCILGLEQLGTSAQSVKPSWASEAPWKTPPVDSPDYRHQRDLIDMILLVLHRNPDLRLDTVGKSTGKIYFSGAPSLTVSEVTGWGVAAAGQAAFFVADRKVTNLSAVQSSVTVTQNKQLVLPLQSSIWTKGNKFNIVGDWRFLAFPEDTYGLGGLTTLSEGYKLNYDYVRFYQFLLRQWAPDFFAGIGYQLDFHYNIEQLKETNQVTDYDNYGFSAKSRSAGVALNILYDTRKNSINPEGGSSYANIILRQNLTQIGSYGNWSSVVVDLRKYFSFPAGTQNILAFWSYDWLILSGHPPYLDLPSNGWDTYNNTGRGYIQSRFRSKDMVDLEAEYRFGILANGLLGGVVFANTETFSQMNPDMSPGRFVKFWPGVGTGIRLKFNKFSKTNVGLDYAWGIDGNNGIFVNLGEVF